MKIVNRFKLDIEKSNFNPLRDLRKSLYFVSYECLGGNLVKSKERELRDIEDRKRHEYIFYQNRSLGRMSFSGPFLSST